MASELVASEWSWFPMLRPDEELNTQVSLASFVSKHDGQDAYKSLFETEEDLLRPFGDHMRDSAGVMQPGTRKDHTCAASLAEHIRV